MALTIGTRLGPYEIRSQIGAGGMGVVYEAQPPVGDRVAVKLLQGQRLDDERAVRRFHDEGTAGSIVVHPNVVSTLAQGETEDGIPFLVMKRVCGEPLGIRIQRDGPPSLRRGIEIVQQILAGVDAMHAAGIVHGDLKSDNVLIERRADGSDVAMLIDFGLAHVQFCAADVRRPHPGEELVSGTPDYMAPEVIRGEGSSRASDLYAVGVILYETITGSTPFQGGSPGEIVRRHLHDRVVPPSLRRTSVPAMLEGIVLRALEKQPAFRFESAAAFAAALALALPGLDDGPSDVPIGRVSREAPTLDWNWVRALHYPERGQLRDPASAHRSCGKPRR